jgi:hypothetical protein
LLLLVSVTTLLHNDLLRQVDDELVGECLKLVILFTAEVGEDCNSLGSGAAVVGKDTSDRGEVAGDLIDLGVKEISSLCGLTSWVGLSVPLQLFVEVSKVVDGSGIPWLNMVAVGLLEGNQTLESLDLGSEKSKKLGLLSSVLLLERGEVGDRDHAVDCSTDSEDWAVILFVGLNSGSPVLLKSLIDLILPCLNGLDDVLDLVSEVDVLALGGLLQSIAPWVDLRKLAAGGERLNLVTRGVENLNLSKGSREWNRPLTSEVVLINLLVDESLGQILNLVKIPEVNLGRGISFWEPQLSLDLIWHKRQSLSSVVLDSSGGWHVHIWAKVVVATWIHSEHGIKLRDYNTYGTGLLSDWV